jgi:hypothetical protein
MPPATTSPTPIRRDTRAKCRSSAKTRERYRPARSAAAACRWTACRASATSCSTCRFSSRPRCRAARYAILQPAADTELFLHVFRRNDIASAPCLRFPAASRSCPRIRPAPPCSRRSLGRPEPCRCFQHHGQRAHQRAVVADWPGDADGGADQHADPQIAQLNGQLSQSATANNGGGTIEDQRDELVQQLRR